MESISISLSEAFLMQLFKKLPASTNNFHCFNLETINCVIDISAKMKPNFWVLDADIDRRQDTIIKLCRYG